MARALSELQALSQVLDAIDVGFCAFDEGNRTLLWNRAFLKMFPEHAGHIHVGEPVADNLRRLPSGQRAPADELLAGPSAQLHHVALDDGRSIHVASIAIPEVGRVSVWRARPAGSGHADPGGHREPGQPLSRRDLERGYRLLAELSSEVIVAAIEGRIDFVSPSVLKLLGRSPQELVGTPCRDLLVPAHASMLDAALDLGMTQPLQARARHGDGSEPWIEIKITEAPDAAGTSLLHLRDIGARKAAESQLAQASRELEALALTDGLTGAANRRSFDLGLEAEWRRALRDGKPLALLLFDVDFFKRLNDSNGHPAGDEVLRRLAAQLRANARRPGDLHARFGGEEFALVLPSTNAEAAMHVADKVRRGFAGCFADRPELACTVSAGLAVAPQDAGSPAELLQRADEALYRAKAQGRDRCVKWEPAPPAGAA